MKSTRRLVIIVVVVVIALLLLASPVYGHHPYAAFDNDKTIKIEGKVVQYLFANRIRACRSRMGRSSDGMSNGPPVGSCHCECAGFGRIPCGTEIRVDLQAEGDLLLAVPEGKSHSAKFREVRPSW